MFCRIKTRGRFTLTLRDGTEYKRGHMDIMLASIMGFCSSRIYPDCRESSANASHGSGWPEMTRLGAKQSPSPLDRYGVANSAQILGKPLLRDEIIADFVFGWRHRLTARPEGTLLHREADNAGLTAFISARRHGTSGGQVLNSIAASDEYFARAASQN